jgi:hypothetical protein
MPPAVNPAGNTSLIVMGVPLPSAAEPPTLTAFNTNCGLSSKSCVGDAKFVGCETEVIDQAGPVAADADTGANAAAEKTTAAIRSDLRNIISSPS